MKRVAVSQRIDRLPERQEKRDALDQRVVTWLEAAGGLAFPLPNNWSAPQNLHAWLAALDPEAVILSGGEDLQQTPERDDTESALLRWAQTHRLPVLGWCRGLQVMSAFAGGVLVRLPGHAGCRHPLDAENSSKLSSEVNSFHAWGLTSCPPGYTVLARASDGSIEAVRHAVLPWEGWMWHPEREFPFAAGELSRFRLLLESR